MTVHPARDGERAALQPFVSGVSKGSALYPKAHSLPPLTAPQKTGSQMPSSWSC